MKSVNTILIIILLSGYPAFSQDIHEAANQGDLPLVSKYLKENPELLNKKNQDEMTPLHIAVAYNKKVVAEFCRTCRHL